MTADPLRPLLDLPGVADAVAEAREACEELRWHEAFRRRWREARAEATIRSAAASATLDGARVSADALRGVAVGAEVPEASAAGTVSLGALRAAAQVEQRFPALGGKQGVGRASPEPFGQLLASLHAAASVGLGLVRPGVLRAGTAPQDLYGLGSAPEGDEVAARVAQLGAVVRMTRAPALIVAAVVHGELLAVRPFDAANGVVARAMARLLLVRGGLDVTGAAVPEVAWAAVPNPYLASAAGFSTGGEDGVAGWLRSSAHAVVEGAAEGRRIADAVLAGRLDSMS